MFTWLLEYFLPFIILISVIVFVHEWGHFWVARRNKVKVEHFAIGFGPELIGFSDRHGTRWAFHLIPLGGYVKMLGDADATSATADSKTIEKLSKKEKEQTLHAKTPWQRIQVAAGGPLANFIFAIVAMIGLFSFFGKPILPPVIGTIDPVGIAAKCGLEINDRIISINDESIRYFEDVLPFVRSEKHGNLSVKVLRKEKHITIQIPLTQTDPATKETKRIKILGIRPSPTQEYEPIGFGQAVQTSFSTFWKMCKTIVIGLTELLTGQRKSDELGGIFAIGDMASQSAKLGFAGMLWFIIVMSINLGLINLFPIPVLDGGQILLNAIEWIIGKPIPEKIQKYVFGTGFVIVICLMLYSTWNDLMRYKIFQMIRGLLPV